jgi:hypothetical protein
MMPCPKSRGSFCFDQAFSKLSSTRRVRGQFFVCRTLPRAARAIWCAKPQVALDRPTHTLGMDGLTFNLNRLSKTRVIGSD